ncbi:MAG: hypothetical protein V3T01_08000 [Myxococcota bacterium]
MSAKTFLTELKLGKPAPEIAFLGEDDREVRLSELWCLGPTILVFLRHFG